MIIVLFKQVGEYSVTDIIFVVVISPPGRLATSKLAANEISYYIISKPNMIFSVA